MTVRRVSNGVITTIAGNGSRRVPATEVRLPVPASSHRDRGRPSGNVYITENPGSAGYIIRKVSASNGSINIFAGGGTNANDGAAATSALLSSLSGYLFAGAGGTLYFSDQSRVRAIQNGTLTTIVGGSPCLSGIVAMEARRSMACSLGPAVLPWMPQGHCLLRIPATNASGPFQTEPSTRL